MFSQFAFSLYLYFFASSFFLLLFRIFRKRFYFSECNELKSRTVGRKQRVESDRFLYVCVCVTVTINRGMCSILTYGHQSISCVCVPVCVWNLKKKKQQKKHMAAFPKNYATYRWYLCKRECVCVCSPHKFDVSAYVYVRVCVLSYK